MLLLEFSFTDHFLKNQSCHVLNSIKVDWPEMKMFSESKYQFSISPLFGLYNSLASIWPPYHILLWINFPWPWNHNEFFYVKVPRSKATVVIVFACIWNVFNVYVLSSQLTTTCNQTFACLWSWLLWLSQSFFSHSIYNL